MSEESGAMGDLWDDPLQTSAFHASVEAAGTNNPSPFYAFLTAAATPPVQDISAPQCTTQDNMYDFIRQQRVRQWVQQPLQLSIPSDCVEGQHTIRKPISDTSKVIENDLKSTTCTPMNGDHALQDYRQPPVTDEMIGISQYLRYAGAILETTHNCSPALEKARPIYLGFLRMLWTQWMGGAITTSHLFYELNKFVNSFVGNPEFSFIRECKAWYDREHQREQEERIARLRQKTATCQQPTYEQAEDSPCSYSVPSSQGEMNFCCCPGVCICPLTSPSHLKGIQQRKRSF